MTYKEKESVRLALKELYIHFIRFKSQHDRVPYMNEIEAMFDYAIDKYNDNNDH